MAKLSKDDVLELARLAKLRLSQDEIHQFAGELSAILDYVERLSSVDTQGLDPTAQVTGLTNVTRPDALVDYRATPEDLLKNVPSRESGYIKVKRVLG